MTDIGARITRTIIYTFLNTRKSLGLESYRSTFGSGTLLRQSRTQQLTVTTSFSTATSPSAEIFRRVRQESCISIISIILQISGDTKEQKECWFFNYCLYLSRVPVWISWEWSLPFRIGMRFPISSRQRPRPRSVSDTTYLYDLVIVSTVSCFWTGRVRKTWPTLIGFLRGLNRNESRRQRWCQQIRNKTDSHHQQQQREEPWWWWYVMMTTMKTPRK